MRRVLSLWKGEMLVPVGPTWKETAAAVAYRHGVTLADLRGPSRLKKVAHARHEAFAIIRQAHTLSDGRIGQLFGGRDASTVWRGVQAHEDRLAGRPYSRARAA